MQQPVADGAQARHQALPGGLLQPLTQTSDVVLPAGVIFLPLRIQTLYLKGGETAMKVRASDHGLLGFYTLMIEFRIYHQLNIFML